MSTNAVRAALEARLGTWAAARSPALRIAWQNVTFDAATAETYLAAFLLPADTESQDLEGDHRAFRGLLQVTVVCPVGIGAGDAYGIAAEIDTLFPVNGRYTSGSVTTQIIGPASVGPALQDEHQFQIPVSIPYRADTI